MVGEDFSKIISGAAVNISERQVAAVLTLLDEGATIPFIARYRKEKTGSLDEVQLAAQAMCLEEQYGIHIGWGAFFYHEIRHRVEVEITPYLRNIVRQCTEEMHSIYSSGRLPAIIQGKHCDRCSLNNLCMPEMANQPTASTYLKRNLYEETT